MLSFVFLSLFIILVYVSGLTINNIETSSISLTKDNIKAYINNSSILATAIITPSSFTTIELSTKSILGRDRNSLQSSSATSTSTKSTLLYHPTSIALSSSLSSSSSAAAPEAPATIVTTRTTTTSTTTKPTTKSTTSTPLNIESPSTFISESTEGFKVKAFTRNNVDYINITSQAGSHAYLPCAVKQLVDKPVSWIRVRDGHILTVDQTTFIADERYQSIYTQNPERWSLQIKYVQIRDAGSYECQVSTEPKMSARVQLNVIKPKTEILGEKIRHVKAGSRVILRCLVSGALEPPLFINWFFDRKQIYLHNKNSWQTELDREISSSSSSASNENSSSNHSSPKQNTIASLIIPSVTKKDSGNYTCSPSNSESVTVILHVLNGEYSASAITSLSCDLFHFQFNFHGNWMIMFCYFYIIMLSII